MIKIFDKDDKELSALEVDSLRGADLSYANLRGANLRGADLCGADLIIITWSNWPTYITPGQIRIGCQSHTLDEWRAFTDEQIAAMHYDAPAFWKENKKLLIELCERFEKGQK